MSEKMICPICGQPTRQYMGNYRKDRLCGKHADLLKKGEIILNEKGEFIEKSTGKVLNKTQVTQEKPKEVEKPVEIKEIEEQQPIFKCIACGKATKDGHLFCGSCYHEYHDKQLLVKITKCKEITILDESYEGVYKCKDGHIVKSKSEREIDNYLFDKGIPHAYEKTLPIDGEESHNLHPDFCLPNYKNQGKDVYIEHWGFNSNNRDYYKSKKYKMGIYKKLGITIISTNEDDMNDPIAALDRKLNNFKYDTINFDEDK